MAQANPILKKGKDKKRKKRKVVTLLHSEKDKTFKGIFKDNQFMQTTSRKEGTLKHTGEDGNTGRSRETHKKDGETGRGAEKHTRRIGKQGGKHKRRIEKQGGAEKHTRRMEKEGGS